MIYTEDEVKEKIKMAEARAYLKAYKSFLRELLKAESQFPSSTTFKIEADSRQIKKFLRMKIMKGKYEKRRNT